MGGDITGDAIGDALAFDLSKHGLLNKWITKLHNSKLPDLLIGIDSGIGGTTSIEYEVSTKLDNTGNDDKSDLPFPVRVVKNVTKTDGLGHSYTTNYNYSGGVFETNSREFRGFGYVKVSDPEGHYKETFFNQDDVYKGRPSKEVVYDKYSRKIQEVDHVWDYIQYNDQKVTFPRLRSKQTTLYDYKTGNSKLLETTYDYDNYGNLIKSSELGFAGGGDEKATVIEYAIEDTASTYIIKPKRQEVQDSSGAKVAETRYYYDYSSSLGDISNNGALTKEERWLNKPSSKYISTKFTYDAYGNVETVKDALNRITTTAYDATKTFPASVRNVLTHTQSFTYDYATGKIKTSRDPNGQTTTSNYDGFGRLIEVVGPGNISKVNYAYDLTSFPTKVTSVTKVSDTENATTCSWSDGLGRTIETISEADGGQYILSGIVRYDSRGQVIEKYLPVYTGNASFSPPAYTGKHVTYQYDPLGRVTDTIRPDGNASQNIYAITSTEAINENGQRKRVTKDAYGRIVTVEEFNEGATYVTTYEYDTLGNLIKTIDTLGNETTIKYDSLGRKIDMNDPDMGVWTYEYDDVGNLASQTDNKGQTITFQYDAINRLKYKSTGVTYDYDLNRTDTDSFSAGRLSQVIDQSGTTKFAYDRLGRETKTMKTLGSATYNIERTYDSLDRLISVAYPVLVFGDTPVVVEYTYNKRGGIKTVKTSDNSNTFISDTEYNVNGQITRIEYGNGTATDYAYDADNLRLTDLNTFSGATPIQNLSYVFDPVGNVKQIIDSVHSNTQSFNYDDLNRLVSSSAPRYGTINYAYNPIGNMTQKGETAMTYGESGAGPHALTSYGSTSILYDQNGNMSQKGSKSFIYDQENRLTEAGTPNGGEVSWLDIYLEPGWNFISIPYNNIEIDGTLTPIGNIPISTLLSDISGKYQEISKYDPQAGAWLYNIGNAKFDQFSNFVYGEGYLVYAAEACSFNLKGTTISSTQQKNLETGWNLVLAPTDTTIEVDRALNNVTYDYVKGYNGTDYDDVTVLEAGKSYWVHVPTTQTWAIAPTHNLTLYAYDGDGGRVKRTVDDRTTIYIGSSYEFEIDNTTGDVLKYKMNIFMGSKRVCEVEQIGNNTPKAYFVHADHIGSSNVLTDETGSRVSLFEHKPFGSLAYADEANTYDTDKRFTGKTYDASAGICYYGARYYDPELGRFITADPTIQHPYDPQDFNRYAYCRNNPIKYIDPTGYGFWSWLGKALGWLVGAIVGAAVTIATGNPILGGMVGGGISGAISGAIDGGLEGALKGAMLGVAIGGAVGGIIGAVGPPGSDGGMGMPGGGLTIPSDATRIAVASLGGVGPSMSRLATAAAAQSIITSGAGAGAAIISNVVASAGMDLGKNAVPGYSTTIGKANSFGTSMLGGDFSGATSLSKFNIQGEGYYSAIEWSTTSPYSSGTISIDKLSIYGDASFAGFEGELSASVIEVSSEHRLFTAKNTIFYAHSSGGWGAKIKGAFKVDLQKGTGRIGFGTGFGPTGEFEIRWKNVNRWR